MDVSSKILKEAIALLDQVMKNKFDEKQVRAAVPLLNILVKQENVIIQAHATAFKYQRTLKDLEKMNIIDISTAVDLGLGDPGLDKVKCPLKDGALIYRSECLDFNGEEKNYYCCRTCDNKAITARKMIDDKQ